MTDSSATGPLTVSDERTPDGGCVLYISGELDAHSSPQLARHLERLQSGGERTVRIDLHNLGFVDSSGLRVLIRAHRSYEEAGGELRLSNPSSAFRRLVEITGLADFFRVEPSVQ